VRRALQQTHGVRYVPNFVSIGLFCRPLAAIKTNFSVFWTSAFCGVANCGQSDKFEYGCTTTNQGIKIVNTFMAKSGAQSLMFKSVTNKHTKTQRFWLLRRRVNSDIHQSWHRGMCDRARRVRSHNSKTLVGPTHSFAARGTENLGESRYPLIKTPSLRIPLSKSIQMLTVNAPETRYDVCKFRENRAGIRP